MGSCLYKVIFFQKYTVFLPKKSRIIFLKVIHPVQCTLMVVVWWFEMCWTMLPPAALCCRRPTKDAHLSRIEAASSSSSSGNYGDDDFWEWWWYNDHDVVTCVHAHVYQSTSSSFTSFLSCAPLPPLNFKKWEPCLLSPLCFVVFPPFSLSQLFPICRFHFLNTSFLLTLRFKHPCCICFHIALVFSHPLCYVVTFTLFLSWFSPICRIFITLMSSIKN